MPSTLIWMNSIRRGRRFWSFPRGIALGVPLLILEFTQLKLDTECLILSACSTATADKLGAVGLSGLAKPFFYGAPCASRFPLDGGERRGNRVDDDNVR